MAKRYNSGSYEGMDQRRAQERQDSEMISEDRSAIANMPQNVIMREYPHYAEGIASIPSDNLAGIDSQIRMDHSGMRKHNMPKKV